MKSAGTISIGVKAPIIHAGDDLVKITAASVIAAAEELKLPISDRDVIAVTEAVVAKAQGNYATLEQVSKDVKQKFEGAKTLGFVFPIYSRNRISLVIKAIANAVDKLIIQLNYPKDEQGNPLINIEKVEAADVNIQKDSFNESGFVKTFGKYKHPFTGVDYVEYFKSLSPNIELIFSNNPSYILKHTKYVIAADVHTREKTKAALLSKGAKLVLTQADLLNKSIDGSGYNEQYGLLGANIATDSRLKLFPRNCEQFAKDLQDEVKKLTGKTVECMVYGDGAFKDPIGGIWELADPVVSPGYTAGLVGTPNELKLKYIADNQLNDLKGGEAEDKMKQLIKAKTEEDKYNKMSTQGTTPRRLTDLLGSLADLTSGSGDKGTPIILIKNYFKTYADD